MYVNVRIKHARTPNPVTIQVELPKGLRDYNKDTINGYVSDYLDEMKIAYKWYKVILNEAIRAYSKSKVEGITDRSV